MAKTQAIAFIGLGAMGSAMSRNLLEAGFKVAGYDLQAAAGAALAAAGGKATATPGACCAEADLVITMLPNAPDVDAALDGPDGILAASPGQRLLMNCSTIDPSEARRLDRKARAAGWRYVDCAVGRTATQAVEGKCLFLIGGEAADKAAVRGALEAMGDTIIDCGSAGKASTLKIVNNYLALVGCLATAEALLLADAGGVTSEAALEVINGTTARNGNSQLNFPNKVLKGDVAPGFSLNHGRKDLAIAVDVMKREGLASFLGGQALRAFDAARERGHGMNDCSDILNALAAQSGRSFGQ